MQSNKRHTTAVIDQKGMAKLNALREAVIVLDEYFCSNLPDGREKNIALIKLEEARMWAIRGLSLANERIPTEAQLASIVDVNH